MADDQVVDASVLGAALFNETHSTIARQFLGSQTRLIAPSLILAEIASISAKKVWRSEATEEVARRALLAIDELVDELVPGEALVAEALDLALAHKVSAYDAFYLALARARGVILVTLDRRLIAKARETGIGHLLREPGE